MSDTQDGNDQAYRLTGNNHHHNGTALRRGDTFVPTERELEMFGSKFERVGDAADVDLTVEPTQSTSAATDHTDVGELLEKNVEPLAEEIGNGEYDAILDEIEKQAERTGVKDAVSDRRGEL